MRLKAVVRDMRAHIIAIESHKRPSGNFSPRRFVTVTGFHHSCDSLQEMAIDWSGIRGAVSVERNSAAAHVKLQRGLNSYRFLSF